LTPAGNPTMAKAGRIRRRHMTDSQKHLPQTLHAIGMMVASMACFSAMNVMIRFASDELHTTQIVFLRNLFSVALLMPWVLRVGSGALRTDKFSGHFWRATVGTVGMQLWFYCVTTLPLNEATALSFTAPILTAIFAIVFLGEKAGLHRWSAIMIGFVGAMVIIRPSPDHMNWNMLLVPCATSMWAIAGLLVKSLTKTELPNRIVFYMAFIMTLWSAPLGIWHWQTPSMYALVMVLGVAVASTGAHLFLVRAYARAEVVVLMPFDFCRLLFTALLAYLVFGEIADRWTWIGSAIIVISAAYIAYRESLHRKRRAA